MLDRPYAWCFCPRVVSCVFDRLINKSVSWSTGCQCVIFLNFFLLMCDVLLAGFLVFGLWYMIIGHLTGIKIFRQYVEASVFFVFFFFLFFVLFCFFFATLSSHLDFFHGKSALLSPRKASCDRVALRNLPCTLGVLVFP